MPVVGLERVPIVQATKENMDALAMLALPDLYEFPFPELYKLLWQLLTTELMNPKGFSKFAVGLPRGFAKTTVMKLLILYIILHTDRNYILIVGRTADLAESILSDVDDMLSEPNILALFGDWKVGLQQDTQSLKVFTFQGRNIILAAVGAGSKSVRGRNRKNKRPDVILMDDMQDWEGAASPVISDQLLTWMTGTLMKAASKARCTTIFVGNMYPFQGSILRILKKNAEWISFIAGGILADGKSLWEELQSTEQLLQEYRNDIALGKGDIFLAEVLNDDTANGKSGIDLGKLLPAPPELLAEPFLGNFIVIDPAGSKTTSDDSVIGYFEVRDGKPCLMKLLVGKWTPGDLISSALSLASETRCSLIAVEAVAYQQSLLFWFKRAVSTLGYAGINFAELQPRGSKNYRIREALNQMLKGELQLSPDVHSEVIYQLSNWHPLKRDNKDDILDVLAYAYQVIQEFWGAIASPLFTDTYSGARVLDLEDNSPF